MRQVAERAKAQRLGHCLSGKPHLPGTKHCCSIRLIANERGMNVHTSEILSAWRKILRGERPSLSIEITRECPLQCPGCYAYDDAHLGGGATLRSLADRKGQELIDGVLALVDRIRPLHLSIVGGDPLVRYRELESMIPLLLHRRIHVQVVTSPFRPLAASWAELPHMN